VAKRLGRRYIGIEREERYVGAARERIAAVRSAAGQDDATLGRDSGRRSAPRLPFAALLEAGVLLPGQALYFDRRRDRPATVLADGTLRLPDGARGSIHRTGAAMLAAPSCNGWDHWYYEDDAGALVVIDVLREQLRARGGSEAP
jgi:modification methylase